MKNTKNLLLLTILVSFALLASCTNATTQTTSTGTIAVTTTSQVVSTSGKITLNNESITITSAGTYEISGNIADGKITVDTDEDAEVILKLDGVNITSSTGEAIFVKSGKATIELVAGSENTLTDAKNYVDTTDDAPNATIYAEEDMKITGSGKLTVNANYNDAITSKDDLTILGGNIIIIAADDGIRGKDSLTIKDGIISVTSGGDALKSDDETKGNLIIDGGNITIAAKSDGIQAYNTLTINGGIIDITESEEGLESEEVIINGGEISIVATDDGINASSSVETATENAPGQADTSLKLIITGGNLTVDAMGDGLDSNGIIEMSGGDVIVYGPTNDGNSALDYDGTFNITGGNLIAFGSAGMAQNASATSLQNTVLIGLSSSQASGTKFAIKNSSGNTIHEAISKKEFQAVLVSTSNLKTGESYTYEANGANIGNFTVSSVTSTAGTITNRMGGGMGGRGMPPAGFSGGNMPTPPNMHTTTNTITQ